MAKGRVVVLKDKVVEQEGKVVWKTDSILVRKWPGDKEMTYLTHARLDAIGRPIEGLKPITRQGAKELIAKGHGIGWVR